MVPVRDGGVGGGWGLWYLGNTNTVLIALRTKTYEYVLYLYIEHILQCRVWVIFNTYNIFFVLGGSNIPAETTALCSRVCVHDSASGTTIKTKIIFFLYLDLCSIWFYQILC